MKVEFKGRQVEAVEVGALFSKEPWSEHQLSDGKVLMYKDTLVSVFKVLEEKNPDGSDIYTFQTQRVVRVK